MSGFHAGLKTLKKFDCNLCDSNSIVKERNGCGYLKNQERLLESVFVLETGDTIYRIYHCPFSLISSKTLEWYKRYKNYKRFNNAPVYEKMSKLFLEKCNIYENSLAELQGE